MPSPFPGIDPYLETQSYGEGFHQRFMTYNCDALNDSLPESYIAQLGEHFHLVEPTPSEAQSLSQKGERGASAPCPVSDGPPRQGADAPRSPGPAPSGTDSTRILPDLAIIQRGRKTSRATVHRKPAGGTLTLEPVTIPLPRITMEVRDVWIEIRRLPKRTPVAVIEVLSPTNKVSVGWSAYWVKRRNTIHQKVHLIEFDFVLTGQRLPMGRSLPRGDCYALIARAERRPDCGVFAWTMRDRLPPIPVSLLPPDPDLILDLGSVFSMAYDKGRYSELIDYSAPLNLARKPEDRKWAEGVARVRTVEPRAA